jgi:uncharacterized membrane protein
MTWRRRLRRRLLWAGVLLGLVVLLATVSVVRVGLWATRRGGVGRAEGGVGIAGAA